jgi:RNA polymerase sigma factor (sigma-70 family)
MKQLHPIEYVYKDYSYFLGFVIKKTKDRTLAEDLIQDTFLQLMTMNQHKLLIIIDSGRIKTYVCKIMMVKYFSKKSQFNKKYVQFNKNKISCDSSFLEHLANKGIESEDDSIEWCKEMQTSIDNCLETFDDYDRKIFNLYYELGLSFPKLEDELGISQRSLRLTITKVRNNIKELIS